MSSPININLYNIPMSEPNKENPIPNIESTAENEPQIIKGVIFFGSPKRTRDGKLIGIVYKSSHPDRKAIVLSEDSPAKPNPIREYAVRVIEDTNPEDPMQGKLIVEIDQTIEEKSLDLTDDINFAQSNLEEKLENKAKTEDILKNLQEVEKLYRDIEGLYKKRQMEYVDAYGEPVKITDELSRSGFTVGQKVHYKKLTGGSVDPISKIIGFTEDGETVLETENEQILAYSDQGVIGAYEVVEEEPERQMEFEDIDTGLKFKVTNDLEKYDRKVGQKIELREMWKEPEYNIRNEVKNAKELVVVGFTPSGKVVTQLDGGKTLSDELTEHIRYYKKVKEESERQMEYIDLYGIAIKLTDELSRSGFAVGQKVRNKKAVPGGIDPISKIIGFTEDGETVLETAGKILSYSDQGVIEAYEVVEEKQERQMEFIHPDGTKVKVTKETENHGLRVGQKVKVKVEHIDYASIEQLESKETTIVGFTMEGYIVTQIDNGAVYTSTLGAFEQVYEIVEESSFSVELKDFNRSNKIKTVIAVRSSTGKGLREASEFIEAVKSKPQVIKEGLTREQAEAIKKQFEEVGASVEIRNKERQMEFEAISGHKVRVTDETEKYGITIGQQLNEKQQIPFAKVNNPKKLKVVGFLDNGNIVVQLDEGIALIYTKADYENLFDPI